MDVPNLVARHEVVDFLIDVVVDMVEPSAQRGDVGLEALALFVVEQGKLRDVVARLQIVEPTLDGLLEVAEGAS